MSLHRLILRSLRRSSSVSAAAAAATNGTLIQQRPQLSLVPIRTFAFSSAEEAAAERRRRKRRLRIEPPLHALRRDPNAPRPKPDPNAPRLPDSTSALVGPRLNLHNRVQSFIRAGDLDLASATARQSVFSNTRPTVFTCNAIIAAMYRNKRFDDAIALFHFFFNQSNIVPNVVSYNVLINTHCDAGRVDVSLDIYRHILANAPFSPSPVTYRHITKGLIDSGRIDEAVDLLREMLNKGHGADSLVYNNLISGFLNLENEAKAIELFDELKERCLVYDGVVNGTFMDWYFTKGRGKDAMDSYKSLLDRQFRMTPPTCNALLEVLLKHDKKVEAWAFFDQMLDNHTPPNFQAVNSDTFSVMVNECVKLGNFSEAIEVFKKVGTKPGSKPFAMDVAGYNNIIARFCENGLLTEAEQLFGELTTKSLTPDVNIYRTFIDAYLRMERVDDALQMFHRFVDSGLRVIVSFSNRVFDEFVNKGKAGESVAVLIKMGEKDPKPDPMTYEIVIKGLCKERLFDACRDLIGQMMRFNIGVTPSLRDFVVEAFGKEGRSEEIEGMLEASRAGFGAYRSPAGPPRMAGPPQHMSRPPQHMSGPPQHMSGPPQRMGGPPQHMGGPPPQYMSGPPQHMGGPPPQRMSGPPQHISGPPQHMGGPGYPSYMAGHPPHMAGHPQMAGPHQTAGHPSHMAGHPQHMAGPPQMAGHPQVAEPPQMPGYPQMEEPFWMEQPPQMEEHPRMAGQASA